MIKTMLGEIVSEFGNCVCIDNGLMLSKEQFEMIKLPELNENERKYYDKVKRVENGDKRKMVEHVMYDYETDSAYRIIEAIVKGGYNY